MYTNTSHYTADPYSSNVGPVFEGTHLLDLVRRSDLAVHVVRDKATGRIGVIRALGDGRPPITVDVVASLPPLTADNLGDVDFGNRLGARYSYVGGEMAKGISTTEMVVALAEAGMVGIFGSGGLDSPLVARAVDELHRALPGQPNWGINLINAPHQPDRERAIADIVLAQSVPIVSASAFLAVTASVVRCSSSGLSRDRQGNVVRMRSLIGKISRPEVAQQFLSPAPADLLSHLVAHGQLTDSEADLAATIPVADYVTVEADSGGHTDHRPLAVVLPAVAAARDDSARRFGYRRLPLVGAAGGLGTPQAVASAFALGADYVVTGSVNQASIESGLDAEARMLLADADIVDTTTAPSADMFELGTTVQVLQRGTMFANRANLLAETYRRFDSLDAITPRLRTRLEREVFQVSIESAWTDTVRYWEERDPAEITRARVDPKHRMALVFRAYLGQTSRWAVQGNHDRRHDYQVWCGPAMGAFNRWTRGSYLAEPDHRAVVQIARNLLEGAAVLTRVHQLRTFGVRLPASAFTYDARRLGSPSAPDITSHQHTAQ